VALDGRWSGIGWEGEAFCPHLPSSPATERPVMHLLREGVSLEGRQQPDCGSSCQAGVSLEGRIKVPAGKVFRWMMPNGRLYGKPS